MIFYLYLEPEIVREARDSGPHAVQNLIAILRGFLQNCCVLEFDDRRIQDKLGEYVKALPEDFDRKVIKALLAKMNKLQRFIYCIEPDYLSDAPDFEHVVAQVDALGLDLLLVVEDHAAKKIPGKCQSATLLTYQGSLFEDDRSRLSSDGSTCADGTVAEGPFLYRHFFRALRHASEIHICDRLVGKYWGDNYEYTTRKFLEWLGAIVADTKGCRIHIHTDQPAGHKSAYIKGELTTYKASGLNGAKLEVVYYNDDRLPHQRFIVTNQVAISIDRGMDFLDRHSRACRDVEINTKSVEETLALLDRCKGDVCGGYTIP
jgi:hypothetical protein